MTEWWRQPEVTSVSRLPIAAELPPFDDVASARAATASSTYGESPYVMSLDGAWEFRLLGSPREVGDDCFDDSLAWSALTVPGAWSMPGPGEVAHDVPGYTNVVMPFGEEPPEVPEHNPTGVYRRTFTLPAGWKGRRVELRVGSAESVVTAWVNGELVGMGKDSRLPSSFDITPHLRRGRNRVGLVVVQWSDASWLEDQDQWWLGGLHRSVELVSTPATWLAEVALVPGLAVDRSTGLLDVEVGVGGPVPDGWRVEAVVENLRGRRLASTGLLPVPHFEHGEELTELISGMFFPGQVVRQRLEVPGIDAWSHERPNRYRVVVTLVDPEGALVDVRAQLSGFRSVEVGGNELRINGKPVEILGANLHEWDPDRGRAVSPELLRRDLELMKAHHLNAVRFAHYPHHRVAYDLCDELGLYVVDEANAESHARQASLCDDPRYLWSFVERAVRMVRRDRNHPSVILWSLGNESGEGVAHHAMAAAIRRIDPSRPLQYEGGLMHDLYAESSVTDVVCPMYPSIESIVEWAESGRDRRRPLILCEFSHAMGTSNGSLADYLHAIRSHHGLQGGLIWEWVDHGIRRGADGERSWFAYGGDFGEGDRWGVNDGNFCCDGLVSPDRVAHPAMSELSKLAQPVEAGLAGRGPSRRIVLENRRWFSGLDDLRCRWERLRRGEVVESGTVELPAVAPRSTASMPLPGTAPAESLVLTFVPRSARTRPKWAGKDWNAGWAQLVLARDRSAPPRGRAGSTRGAARLLEHGIVVGGVEIAWPELCLWRAPTDNDGIQIGWLQGSGSLGRWRGWGLQELSNESATVVRRRPAGTLTRAVTWRGATDDVVIVHRSRVEVDQGGVTFHEQVDVPRQLDDLPRVGVSFDLPASHTRVEWMGLGPHETYPDRHLAQRRRWRSSVEDLYVDLVHPQEHGHRHDSDWVTFGSGDRGLRIVADRRFGWNASHHSLASLTAARHTTDLAPDDGVHVIIDVAHRGLGTASCGPDTLPRYLVGGGRYRWSWRIEARPT